MINLNKWKLVFGFVLCGLGSGCANLDLLTAQTISLGNGDEIVEVEYKECTSGPTVSRENQTYRAEPEFFGPKTAGAVADGFTRVVLEQIKEEAERVNKTLQQTWSGKRFVGGFTPDNCIFISRGFKPNSRKKKGEEGFPLMAEIEIRVIQDAGVMYLKVEDWEYYGFKAAVNEKDRKAKIDLSIGLSPIGRFDYLGSSSVAEYQVDLISMEQEFTNTGTMMVEPPGKRKQANENSPRFPNISGYPTTIAVSVTETSPLYKKPEDLAKDFDRNTAEIKTLFSSTVKGILD